MDSTRNSSLNIDPLGECRQTHYSIRVNFSARGGKNHPPGGAGIDYSDAIMCLPTSGIQDPSVNTIHLVSWEGHILYWH